MTEEKEKEITLGLITSPDFIESLSLALDQITGKSITVEQFGLFFFSRGYLSCMDYQNNKEMLRPFKYESPM